MKRFISYIAFISIAGGLNYAQAELKCDPVPTSIETAKTCMQGFLGNTTEMGQVLATNKHIGDMGLCQKEGPAMPSYFGNNGIDKVLKNATLGDCEESGDEYKCFVNLFQWACNISPAGTRSKTKTALMRIEKDTGKLSDFHPVKKQ